MLLVLFALTLGAAIFLAAQAATFPARRRRELLRSVASYGSRSERNRPSTTAAAQHRPGIMGRLLAPAVSAIADLVIRVLPRMTRETVGRRLLSAGLAQRVSTDQLLAAKGLLTVLGGLLGIALGSKANVGAAFLFAVSFGALGFLMPDVVVNAKIRDRQDSVRAALPDALDLLAVSVEAGLGFDGAVAKLIQYMGGPLIEEFALTLNEVRIGESRTEALKRMAARVDVPELSSFVRAVVQADQLGTSMGGMLRIQAKDARVRRQFVAEEKAMKAPIKMLIPMAVFILPALFIVILGPALMNFAKSI